MGKDDKEAVKQTGQNFSARRMAKEYTEKFYLKACEAATEDHRQPG